MDLAEALEVLGVRPGTAMDQVREAYRAKVRAAHPDLAGPDVDRDYRIATGPEVRCGIYLQGATEWTHGLSSTLLSNTAVRAGEIVRALTRSAALVTA